MSLQAKILRVLRNSDTQRIRFSFRGVTAITISVNGGSFRQVAEAIESGDIAVIEDRTSVPAGTGSYSGAGATVGTGRSGTFRMGRLPDYSRAFDALVVHEAVHASLDLSRSVVPALDSETAGYIAQGFYLRNSGFKSDRLNPLDGAFFGFMIADSIAGGNGVDDFWLDALHNFLQSATMYQSFIGGTFTGNG